MTKHLSLPFPFHAGAPPVSDDPAEADPFIQKKDARVLLVEGINESAAKAFETAGFTRVEVIKGALDEHELIEELGRGTSLLGIRSRTRITARALEAARDLVAIGAFCIGTNHVDLRAAALQGVPVFNSPYSNTRSVAELVLAEIVMLMRDVPAKNALLHEGKWDKKSDRSYEIRGKSLGIVGYGNIGSQLSVMAEALGMRVFYYDVVQKLPLGNATPVPNLLKLLGTVDVVSLHVPETPGTVKLVGERELAAMKHGAILVNASRGSVVDIDALSRALDTGQLGGAAIDVFPVEPASNDEAFESPLRKFRNVILTPHVGGSTHEAQVNIGEDVAEKLVTYFENGSTIGAVNFPQLSLPASRGFHRLLHVHQNIPGVLTRVNRLFSDNMINVGGQYLLTNEWVGYVVIDVEKEYTDFGVRQMQRIDGTIRTRIAF